MAMQQPVTRITVGVTGPERGGMAAWLASWFAIWRAGGKACRITPGRDGNLDQCQALIIGGGADVGPLKGEIFPEADEQSDLDSGRHLAGLILAPLIFLARLLLGKRQTAAENKARDRLEFDCFDKARQRQLPILGICRGAQLINIALGGRLHRDLSAFYEESDAVRSILPRKQVQLDADSRLAEVLETTRCSVNALHNQAIDENQLGEGLRVCGREDNGIVQAIESDSDWLVLGVQWHPEYLPQLSEQQNLFKCLLVAAHHHHGGGA